MNIQHPDITIRYIKTKNKMRKITAYRSLDCNLRINHQKIYEFIEKRFTPSIFTKGYVRGLSIFHNARAHMYNDYFIMLDIKDFFQRIRHKQLIGKIYHELNLANPQQISKKECIDVVNMCSVSRRGIPLGFITSPILSNIYLKDFDCIFYGKLKQTSLNNIIYTRYADDITVSFKYEEREKIHEIEAIVMDIASTILSRYGLQINKHKIRSYNLNTSNHVRVTGINIIKNDFGKRSLTVGRKIKNALYWDAINCFESGDKDHAQRIKGMQSFILSIEKCGYESCFSDAMMKKVHLIGFDTLKQLIDYL